MSLYAPSQRKELTARLCSHDNPRAVLMEMYARMVLERAGYKVKVHPVSVTGQRPDFLAVKQHDHFYVECATMYPPRSWAAATTFVSRCIGDAQRRLPHAKWGVRARVENFDPTHYPAESKLRETICAVMQDGGQRYFDNPDKGVRVHIVPWHAQRFAVIPARPDTHTTTSALFRRLHRKAEAYGADVPLVLFTERPCFLSLDIDEFNTQLAHLCERHDNVMGVCVCSPFGDDWEFPAHHYIWVNARYDNASAPISKWDTRGITV